MMNPMRHCCVRPLLRFREAFPNATSTASTAAVTSSSVTRRLATAAAATSLKDLPPDVANELRRHVSPRPIVSPLDREAMQAAAKMNKQKTWEKFRPALIGCILFTGFAASLPLAAYYWIGGLVDREEPLTSAQCRRGAFNNSGTKDVGRDPNWDFSNGTYKKDSGCYDIVKNEGKHLPPQFLAMPASDLAKHEAKMEAHAKGLAKNDQ
jgi:hypothetical protein